MKTLDEKKYEEKVVKEFPFLQETKEGWQRMLFKSMVTTEKWFDAIENEDVDFLNQLMEASKKRCQQWLSDEVMNTQIFKYYSLIYCGNGLWYFWTTIGRSKILDKKIEQGLKDRGYSVEDIAKILASRWYRGCLEDTFDWGTQEEKEQIIDEAMPKAWKYLREWEEGEFVLDEELSELVDERGQPGNRKGRELASTKKSFLKEWMFS